MVEGDEDPWMCFLQAEASKGWVRGVTSDK